MAAHSPSMDGVLRKMIFESTKSDRALHALAKLVEEYPELSSSIATTQAIDLIQGGVKANELPENAWAVINHRIATQRYSKSNFALSMARILSAFCSLDIAL